MAERPLEFAPGARHAYSNTNYILLGLAIEHATGMDYWRILQEEILSPLGMRDAGPRRAEERRRIAQGHLFQDGHWRAPPPTAPGSAWAAGGLLASIDDMARFAVALDQHRLLPEASLKRMWCDTLLSNGSNAGWGPAGKFPMAERSSAMAAEPQASPGISGTVPPIEEHSSC